MRRAGSRLDSGVRPANQIDILSGSDASRDKVLTALPNAMVAHFCTHGNFDTADPFQSHLLLANGEPLALDTLLPILNNSKLSEVVLSACETAVVPSWRFADEPGGPSLPRSRYRDRQPMARRRPGCGRADG